MKASLCSSLVGCVLLFCGVHAAATSARSLLRSTAGSLVEELESIRQRVLASNVARKLLQYNPYANAYAYEYPSYASYGPGYGYGCYGYGGYGYYGGGGEYYPGYGSQYYPSYGGYYGCVEPSPYTYQPYTNSPYTASRRRVLGATGKHLATVLAEGNDGFVKPRSQS